MRTLTLLGMTALAGCSTSATAPEVMDSPVAYRSLEPTSTAPGSHYRHPRTGPDTVTLVGVLVGGGDWSVLDPAEGSLWGDSVAVGEPFDLTGKFYFHANNAAGDSVGAFAVATLDSVPFLFSCPVPASIHCEENSAYNCPPSWVLECPPSVDTTAGQPERFGNYVVYLTPAHVPGYVEKNAGSQAAFLLYVYPPPTNAASLAAASNTRPRSAGRAVWRVR